MADLTTLDPSIPGDNDPASQGASKIREERADLLGWAVVEHYKTGPHAFKTGDGTFPALPGLPAVGNAGRIFIDTINQRLLRDDGALWRLLSAVTKAYLRNPLLVTLTASFQNLVTVNVNVATDGWVLALAFASIFVGSGSSTTFQVLMDGTTAIDPGTPQVGVSGVSMITIPAVNNAVTTGNHSFSFQAHASSGGSGTIINSSLLVLSF